MEKKEFLHKITCVKNVKTLENGGLERLDITVGKTYNAFRCEDDKYLLLDDVGEDIVDNPLEIGNWYDKSYFLPFTTEDIIKEVGVHPLKVRNLYLYGSRIYGTATPDSDWDIICITAALLEHEEKRVKVGNDLLNIHLITPDKFQRGLDNHDIMNLECYFSPSWARLQEKIELKFTLNKKKLAKNIIAQSFNSWQGGKHKLEGGDVYRGLKSIFHSLKMLVFAIQIAEHDKITDFSEANYLHSDINGCDEIDWDYFKETYLPLKIELENKLKDICYGKEA